MSILILVQSSCGFVPNGSVMDEAKSLPKNTMVVSGHLSSHVGATTQAGIRAKFGMNRFWDSGLDLNYYRFIPPSDYRQAPNSYSNIVADPTSGIQAQFYNKFSLDKQVAFQVNGSCYFTPDHYPIYEFNPVLLFSTYNFTETFSTTPFVGYQLNSDFKTTIQGLHAGVCFYLKLDNNMIISPEVGFSYSQAHSTQSKFTVLPQFGVSIGYLHKKKGNP